MIYINSKLHNYRIISIDFCVNWNCKHSILCIIFEGCFSFIKRHFGVIWADKMLLKCGFIYFKINIDTFYEF